MSKSIGLVGIIFFRLFHPCIGLPKVPVGKKDDAPAEAASAAEAQMHC